MDEALVRACKKLVLFGGAAGSTDEMLTLLLNGMTVEQLPDIIEQRIIAVNATSPRWTM